MTPAKCSTCYCCSNCPGVGFARRLRPPSSHIVLHAEWLRSNVAILAQKLWRTRARLCADSEAEFFVCFVCEHVISVSLVRGFIIGLDSIVYPVEMQRRSYARIRACTHREVHLLTRTWIPSTQHTQRLAVRCVAYPLVSMSRAITGRKDHAWPFLCM